MSVVANARSLSANSAPEDAVLPQAGSGFLGILMLDTRFPRPPGDVGHPATFPVPVVRLVVEGAFPREVVRSAAALRGSGLAGRFLAAARELVDQGARAITTSCGFLALLQRDLQQALPVPVVTSSLLHLPAVLAREPQVGVLTIDATSLTAEYLLAAGVPAGRLADVLVEGVDPDGEFARCILGNRPEMDLAAAGRDVVAAALRLQRRAPALRTLVLECTNMPPHAAAVAAATGWRSLSLLDVPQLVDWARA